MQKLLVLRIHFHVLPNLQVDINLQCNIHWNVIAITTQLQGLLKFTIPSTDRMRQSQYLTNNLHCLYLPCLFFYAPANRQRLSIMGDTQTCRVDETIREFQEFTPEQINERFIEAISLNVKKMSVTCLIKISSNVTQHKRTWTIKRQNLKREMKSPHLVPMSNHLTTAYFIETIQDIFLKQYWKSGWKQYWIWRWNITKYSVSAILHIR